MRSCISQDIITCSPWRVNQRFTGAIHSIFRFKVQEVALISNKVLKWEFSGVMLVCQNMKLKLYLKMLVRQFISGEIKKRHLPFSLDHLSHFYIFSCMK
jgi:hypothetical protein